jgi:hypothetical protein
MTANRKCLALAVIRPGTKHAVYYNYGQMTPGVVLKMLCARMARATQRCYHRQPGNFHCAHLIRKKG